LRAKENSKVNREIILSVGLIESANLQANPAGRSWIVTREDHSIEKGINQDGRNPLSVSLEKEEVLKRGSRLQKRQY
jgi:hypothetical protein